VLARERSFFDGKPVMQDDLERSWSFRAEPQYDHGRVYALRPQDSTKLDRKLRVE
jgi:hypothetical protein